MDQRLSTGYDKLCKIKDKDIVTSISIIVSKIYFRTFKSKMEKNIIDLGLSIFIMDSFFVIGWYLHKAVM